MAVRFVFGPAGSGKTFRALEALRDCERRGRPGVYLVPEQFTYSADRELLEGSDLHGLRHVRALSFSRFGLWLRERRGEAAGEVLNPSVRPMVLRAALERMAPEDRAPLERLRRRPGFLSELSQFVAEVRNHGPSDLLLALSQLGASDEPPAVKRKLVALGAAYQAYASELRRLGRIDPEERLAHLPRWIDDDREFLAGLHFEVDGFLSWTRRERETLTALARSGATLEISLCIDAEAGCAALGDPDANTARESRPQFLPIERTIRGLARAFLQAGVPLEPPMSLPPRSGSPFRARLERSFGAPNLRGHEPLVEALSATDRRAEVLLWARRIDRWLRLSGDPITPGEIAVVVRDVEPYRDAIHRIFARFGIPYFLDEPRPVLSHPRVRLLLGAFEIVLGGWRREAVIGWLRNPLLGIAPASVDLLENLSLEYGRDFESWYAAEPWEEYASPARERAMRRSARQDAQREFEVEEHEPAEDEEREADAFPEAEREATTPRDPRVPWVDPIRGKFLAPIRLLERDWPLEGRLGQNAAQAIRDLLQALGDSTPSRAVETDAHSARIGQEISDLLLEAARLWPDVPVTLDEFARTLQGGLSALRLGVTPIKLEQVSIAEVRRSRLHGIRRAVLGGLNEGLFPRVVSAGPVLNEEDRDALERRGVALGPSARERQDEELYLFYIALTRASDELLVTWARHDGLSSALDPSLFLRELRPRDEKEEALQELGQEVEAESLLLDDLQTEGELSASWLAAAASPEGEALAQELDTRSARSELPSRAVDDMRLLRQLQATTAVEQLSPSLLARLHPEPRLVSSVSRLEQFAQCPYQSFAAHLLRLEPRPRAEISPIETGSLAHAALEQLFKKDARPRRSEVEALLSATLKGLELEPRFRAFEVDAAARHRWHNVERQLARFLYVESERLASSTYQFEAAEWEFAPPKTLCLALADGAQLELRGRIDRIDLRTLADGSKAALIIDYKRSAKSGVLAGVRDGVDLQLAAYLLYARDVRGWKPAGGLYVPVLPSPIRQEEQKPDAKNPLGIVAQGIFLDSERDGISGDVGLVKPPRKVDRLDEQGLDRLLETASGYMRDYAQAWRSGWIAPRPLERKHKKPCEYCEFNDVCRFRSGHDPVRTSTREGLPAPPSPSSPLASPSASLPPPSLPPPPEVA